MTDTATTTHSRRPHRRRRKTPLGRALLTGLKIIGKCLLLLPIPAFMVWFNYTVDISSLFQGEQFELDVAKALIAGEAIDNYDHLNEREIISLLAENLEEPYEVLAYGSSRVLQLRKDVVGVGSFFNAGLSGADFLDMVGITYLFDRAEKLPKTLILGLDPWILSDYSYDRHPLSDRNLYEEFLTLRLNVPTEYEPVDNNERYKALLSPTYFQGNLTWVQEDKDSYTPPATVTGDVWDQKTNIKLGDGSVVYKASFRRKTPDEVEKMAREQAAEFIWMEDYIAPDALLCRRFDEFVQYYKDQGVQVVFLLTPYHPLVYNYAQENEHLYPGFFLTEPWFAEYAEENDIPLYGSYNPFVCGLLDEYFYDGLHMHEEGMAELFPGVPSLQKADEKGWAASPWHTGRDRVEEDTARLMVAQRYEIVPPEELRALPQETLNSVPGWVFGRFESEDEDAVMLARYMVSKDEGVVYRFDDDMGWVVDPRFDPMPDGG